MVLRNESVPFLNSGQIWEYDVNLAAAGATARIIGITISKVRSRPTDFDV